MPEIGDPLYLTLKLAHYLGVVAFLGGITLSAYWKVAADRANDPPFTARVHARIAAMDRQVIGPGALVTFVAGYAMVRGFGRRIGETPFALWGLIFMFLALALWWLPMRRIGRTLLNEAEFAAKSGAALGGKFGANSVMWLASAFLAIALILLVTVLMVFRIPGG